MRCLHHPPYLDLPCADRLAGRPCCLTAAVHLLESRSHKPRRFPRILGALLALCTLLTAPSLLRPSLTQQVPAPSRSRYMSWLTGDPSDVATARRLGCAHARTSSPGVVVLGFGRQLDGGATAFSSPRILRPLALLADVTVAFARSLQRCRPSSLWSVSPMTSNYRLQASDDPARFGAQWAELTRQVAARLRGTGVVAYGGIDLEPGWSPPAPALAWLRAYASSTNVPLLLAASADGCPFEGAGPCAGGWSSRTLATAVWGVQPGSLALPQVYRADAKMARQWSALATRARELGLTPLFAGALSQAWACEVSTSSNCPQLSLPADAAQRQLFHELRNDDLPAHLVVGAGSDIGWG